MTTTVDGQDVFIGSLPLPVTVSTEGGVYYGATITPTCIVRGSDPTYTVVKALEICCTRIHAR